MDFTGSGYGTVKGLASTGSNCQVIVLNCIINEGFCIQNDSKLPGYGAERRPHNCTRPLPSADFVLKMMEFVLKMMEFVLKMMDCLLHMMDFVLQRMELVLQMMDYVL